MAARPVRRATAATVTGALALATAACSNPGATAGGSGGPEDSAVVGIAYEPETLSPLLGYGKDGNSKIFDGLLAFDADMNLEPALASELPRVSADGLTYTYPLRDGVTFSDGAPFTAKDVVFTYRTILDPKTNNASRTELDALESVRAVGDDTVVFTLKYPYAPFAERTVQAIAPDGRRQGRRRPRHPAARRRPRRRRPAAGPRRRVRERPGEEDVHREDLRLPHRHPPHPPPGHRRHRRPPRPRPRRRPAGHGGQDPRRRRKARLRARPHRQPLVRAGHRAPPRPRGRAQDPRRGRLEARPRRRPRQGRRPRRVPALVPLRRQAPPGPRPRLRLRREEGRHRRHDQRAPGRSSSPG